MSVDNREHINVVFIGHVDAGKSTITGQILISTGQIDKRTIEKYEKEAQEKHRESWYLAYVTDISEEERARGKTQECAVAAFNTDNKRVTVLDAPGHSAYVPAMLTGTAQADVACLVISSRKGEFEAGIKGGQTLEHMLLVRTMGISKLIVIVNKMDDSTIGWEKSRYDEITSTLTPLLKANGYDVKRDIIFLPASGQLGSNIKERTKPGICKWYDGPSLFEIFDALPPIPRPVDKPFRFSIIAKNKDMGVLSVIGKLQSGKIKIDDEVISLPNMKTGQVIGIQVDNQYDVQEASAGEALTLKLKNMEESDVYEGCVLSPLAAPGYRSNVIEAQLVVTNLTEDLPIIAKGYSCIMHIHNVTVEVTISTLLKTLNKKGKLLKEHPAVLTDGSIAIVRISLSDVVAVEKFEEFPSLARFVLRKNSNTIAFGKILRLKPYVQQ